MPGTVSNVEHELVAMSRVGVVLCRASFALKLSFGFSERQQSQQHIREKPVLQMAGIYGWWPRWILCDTLSFHGYSNDPRSSHSVVCITLQAAAGMMPVTKWWPLWAVHAHSLS